jgi:hypothetical protein
MVKIWIDFLFDEKEFRGIEQGPDQVGQGFVVSIPKLFQEKSSFLCGGFSREDAEEHEVGLLGGIRFALGFAKDK